MRPRHPLVKFVLVFTCAFTIWSLNHPTSNLSLRSQKTFFKSDGSRLNIRDQGYASAHRSVSKYHKITNQCTKTVTNVVFLKTHKTGSSTMSNIMLRFADTHNLTVGLPLKNHWELGGYPAYIDRRLIDPPLPKYNIIGHHFRFNIENLQDIVPEDARFITIIRAPKDNVESVFGFFVDQSPFVNWMQSDETGTTSKRLETFYDNPDSFFNKNTDWFFRAKNHMFFDSGYDVSNPNDEYIDSRIEEMDHIFSLVLITDYFDESLIMMKNRLCWSWEDIVYIKFKMRIEEAKTEVNPVLEKKILKWNHADRKVYDYFNKTFWRGVDTYGREKMAGDIATLQRKQKEAKISASTRTSRSRRSRGSSEQSCARSPRSTASTWPGRRRSTASTCARKCTTPYQDYRSRAKRRKSRGRSSSMRLHTERCRTTEEAR